MFKTQLKRIMYERGISQTQLSERSGIGKSSLSQYLSGLNVPSLKTKQKLAEALNVPPGYFDSPPEPEIITGDNNRLTPAQAAKLLSTGQGFIRLSLQQGTAPFGFAAKGPGGKYIYHISPKKLQSYIDGA